METHWEPLGKDLRVLVGSGHSFNTDTLLLADFALPRPGEFCADLGCGCGTIGLLWCRRSAPERVLAVELQKEALALAEASVRENGLEDKMVLLAGDLREYKGILPHQGLDLAACNPPYFSPGTGAVSRDPQRYTARHGESLSLEQLAEAAGYALRFGGRLCVCLPAVRLSEAVVVFHRHGLEPKRLRLVQQRPGKEPYLFLLECRRGGKTGLRVEETLCITGADGKYSPEMRRIYGDYLDGAENEKS